MTFPATFSLTLELYDISPANRTARPDRAVVPEPQREKTQFAANTKEGFMRKALTFLALACSLIASANQASSQQPGAEAKNPAIALGFAWLCPGCGHLYSGETTKGALIAAISVGAFATGVAVQFSQSVGMFNDFQEDCALRASESECFDHHMDFTPILIGSAIALAGYVYGLIDAGPSARRMNAKHGLDLGGIDVKPSLDRDGSVSAKFRIPLPVSWQGSRDRLQGRHQP